MSLTSQVSDIMQLRRMSAIRPLCSVRKRPKAAIEVSAWMLRSQSALPTFAVSARLLSGPRSDVGDQVSFRQRAAFLLTNVINAKEVDSVKFSELALSCPSPRRLNSNSLLQCETATGELSCARNDEFISQSSARLGTAEVPRSLHGSHPCLANKYQGCSSVPLSALDC